jgi:hypothetical protein
MTAHLEDATLVQYLDAAIAGEEREAAARHLATCGACADRLAVVQRRTARLAELLAATDVPVSDTLLRTPRRPVPVPALAAAVVLMAATAAATVQPVRAWVVERSLAVWTLVTGGSEAHGAASAERPADPAATASVSFVPSGRTFFVQVAVHQRVGTVTVVSEAGSAVTAEVRGGGPEQLVVLPDGLRIDNTDASSADYTVIVPATLREVSVAVAGRVVVRLTPGGAASAWTVPLGADAAVP